VIHINLMDSTSKARPAYGGVFAPARIPSLIGVGVLLVTALGIGGFWWELVREEHKLDLAIASADVNLGRLRAAAQLVDRANERKVELTERLALIDRLHRVKRDPVELLMAKSKAVPNGLWLIEMKQLSGDMIQVEGRALSLTAVTDFVEALQTSGRFERPVDIITTSMESIGEQTAVRFAVRGHAIVAGAPLVPGAVAGAPGGPSGSVAKRP
jgi:Tfp pilus assembly protein PilN